METSPRLSNAVDFMNLDETYIGLTVPGGDTSIHKLYRDVLPLGEWFFNHLLINRIANSKIFKDLL